MSAMGKKKKKTKQNMVHKESLTSLCDNCPRNSIRTISHDPSSDPNPPTLATSREIDSSLCRWLYSDQPSVLICITLCFALAFHVPSAEMLFPQISMWLIPSFPWVSAQMSYFQEILPWLPYLKLQSPHKNTHWALLIPLPCSTMFK